MLMNNNVNIYHDLYLIGIVMVLALGLLCCDALLKYFRLDRKDKSPLRINTFDDKYSPYHPSVLFLNMDGSRTLSFNFSTYS